MKRSVSWHEECLENMRRSLADAAAGLRIARDRWQRLFDQVEFAQSQIVEAKRRGMTEFDSDRLFKKRALATATAPDNPGSGSNTDTAFDQKSTVGVAKEIEE